MRTGCFISAGRKTAPAIERVIPIVGQISDNLRTRWGRRHPFMYLSAIPVAVSYLLLWNPPNWSDQAIFFYLIAVAIVVAGTVLPS